MTTSIYMIRHAISPFILGEERNRGLSQQGLTDALRIKDILAEEGMEYFISSPYKRAIDTLKYLAEEAKQEIILFEELRERAVGSMEIHMDEKDFLDGIRTSFIDIDFKLPGGESTRAAQERSIPIVKQLLQQYEGSKIALGTHGNIMTIILNYFDSSYGYEFFGQTSKPDIYRLDFDGLNLTTVERLWSKEEDVIES
jgi:2,3-bisphosphoglycerate-dependent phosphoglycerate mutase